MNNLKQRVPPPFIALAGAFAIIYVVWGSTYLAIRFAIESIPPFTMAGFRFLLAGMLLYAVTRPRYKPRITARQWVAAGYIGVLMLVGGNGLVTWSELTVPSGQAALMIATMPIWFALIDWTLFRGPRPTLSITIGLIIGLIGMYILIGPANIEGARVDPKGGGALLLACVFWTLGSLQARRADLPKSAFVSTAMEMLTAGVVLSIIGGVMGEWSRLSLSGVSLRSWLSFGYLVLFGSIVALSAYVWLLQATTPARVSTYAYVNPLIAVLLGAVWANEALTPRVWIAVVVIISAVVLITASKLSKPLTTSEQPNHSSAAKNNQISLATPMASGRFPGDLQSCESTQDH